MGTLLLLGAGTFSGPASAPVNTSAPVISGTNAVGNVLTTTTGTWNGSPAPTFEYWWKRNGVPVVPIPTPGATTYNLTNLDAGLNITCEVYATNPSGTASATSNSLYVYDADAYAYNTATTLTATTRTVALNEFVLDLKGANIWTKFNALYPMITDKVTQVDIANQMKFNLKNPLDTDAAFRLSWVGGWVWSTNGALPNGTNAYADTFLNASTNTTLNSNHLSIYVRTNQTTNAVPIGAFNLGSTLLFQINISTGTGYYYYTGGLPTEVSSAIADSKGFFMGSQRASNDRKIFRNGTALASLTSVITTNNPSLNVFIGARNQNNTAVSYTTQQIAFASIGSGLTDTESQLFYQIVEKYQVALSRNINPTQSFYYNRNYGAETNLYLFATQITNTSTQVAIGTFIGELKSYNIWTKMRAVYPMVTDKVTQVDIRSQMKFNLVNPQDTDASFRLNFIGGLTFSSNGILGNGVNGLADTFLTPSSSLSLNNTHISIYSRTNSDGLYSDMGAQDTTSNNILAFTRYTNIINYRINEGFTSSSVANTDSRGFFNSNRTASNIKKLFKNGTLLDNSTLSSTGLTTTKLGLFALLYNNTPASSSYFTNRELTFASIGDGLTDAEASNFYTAVQNLQTTLGRQV